VASRPRPFCATRAAELLTKFLLHPTAAWAWVPIPMPRGVAVILARLWGIVAMVKAADKAAQPQERKD